MRRWWNRLLIRVGWHKSDWYRATYDANTGWHESFRLARGGDVNGPWVSTRRWHDDRPTDVMDRAAFHVWAEEGGWWRFGTSPERTVLSASFSGDAEDVDMRVAVTADDWSIATPDVLGAATWPYALTAAEVREANAAMTDVEIQEVDRAIVAAGNVHLDAWEPASIPLGPPTTAGRVAEWRVLPDDSRGILVTEMIGPESVDGPHVPASMRTDQIPLPQDFNYPAPAIDLNYDGPLVTYSLGDGRYLALPDATEAADD